MLCRQNKCKWIRKNIITKNLAHSLVRNSSSSSRIETKLESVAEACATIDFLKSKLYPVNADPSHGLQAFFVETPPGSQQPNHNNFNISSADFLQKCFGFEKNINEIVSSERCKCNGHLDRNWESPTYLVSIFGRIQIVRRPSAPCYQSTCRKSCAATSVTTSLFWITPTWWPPQRMISITFNSSPHLNPYISLSFPKIVASDAMVFHMATTGNVIGLRELLEDGAASPDDIKCDGGFTPLHVS